GDWRLVVRLGRLRAVRVAPARIARLVARPTQGSKIKGRRKLLPLPGSNSCEFSRLISFPQTSRGYSRRSLMSRTCKPNVNIHGGQRVIGGTMSPKSFFSLVFAAFFVFLSLSVL